MPFFNSSLDFMAKSRKTCVSPSASIGIGRAASEVYRQVEAIADTKSCSGLIGVPGVMEFRRKYRSLSAAKACRPAASLSYLVG